MHDEPIERRLRATLRDEADRLPFTITPAELERRLLLRNRSLGGRRLGLLLAAAVGIGLFGVGGALGGLFDQPTESPPPPSPVAQITDPAPTSSPSAPVTLPSLDEMLATGDPAAVIVAQAHGPADGPEAAPAGIELVQSHVSLGTIDGSSSYEVTFACIGEGSLWLDIRVPAGRGPRSGPTVACNGSVYAERVGAVGKRSIQLGTTDRASWRIVVRRLDGAAPAPGPDLPILEVGDGDEELIRIENETIEPGLPGSTFSGLALQEVGTVPTREGYAARIWCTDGDAVRFILGDEIDGVFVPATMTHVDCDGSVHDVFVGIPEAFGGRVYVAAAPETRWSVLVSGEEPPVALTQSRPGWQLSAGLGPNLEFEDRTHSFTGPGLEGGGQVLIVLACAGSASLEVMVEVELVRTPQVLETGHFVATCTPDGATSSGTFDTKASYVDVSYTAPAGSWTAMSIMVPDPLPSRN